MSEKEWLRSVTVCETLDKQWYAMYATQQCYFRLTHRGMWSANDMDIYWKSQDEAFAALHVAPCPLEDPYKRIAELKAEIARLRSVCRECSGVLMRQYDKMTLEQVQQLPWLSAAIVTVAQDMGACGDGQSLENTSNG